MKVPIGCKKTTLNEHCRKCIDVVWPGTVVLIVYSRSTTFLVIMGTAEVRGTLYILPRSFMLFSTTTVSSKYFTHKHKQITYEVFRSEFSRLF